MISSTRLPRCLFVRSLLVLWALSVTVLPLDASVDYDALRQVAPEARLRQTIGYLSGLGSRVAGYPGAEKAALYLQKQFRDIGLERHLLCSAIDLLAAGPIPR